MTTTRARVLRVTVHTNVLRAAVAFSGMSHAEIALKAGVSKGQVGNLVSGARTQCKADTAAKLCKALNLKAVKMAPKDLFEVHVIHQSGAAA
jgi:transcriptional regulator with XRE-family HTH domain